MSFSNVEKYFYQRQHEACVTRVMNCFSEPSDTALSAMDQSEVTKVKGRGGVRGRWGGVMLKSMSLPLFSFFLQYLTPLHSLRQACCTPQIVRSSYLTSRDTLKT